MNGTIPLLHTTICLLGVDRDNFTSTFLKTLIKETSWELWTWLDVGSVLQTYYESVDHAVCPD
jgi:hypothetical protein